MGPFGGPVFGAAFLGKREKQMSQVSRANFWVRQADQKIGPLICNFFLAFEEKFKLWLVVGGAVDKAQLCGSWLFAWKLQR